MTARRTERLLNLVICLLATPRYLSREQIRRVVREYAECESDESFERMFERDKDDLREMGIPLEYGSNDPLFEDDAGYRIPRESYALRETTFEPDELAVLGVAARLWEQATLAEAAARAIRKLEASGVDVDPTALALLEPRVAAAEASFGAFYEAVSDRRPVRFQYRPAGAAETAERRVEPWGIVSWHGRWYLVGHDRDRQATRVFRLSRVAGDVVLAGEPGSVVVPDDVDLQAAVTAQVSPPSNQTARVQLKPGAAEPLRRRALALSSAPDGWTEAVVEVGDAESLAAEVCGFGDAVVVLDPPEVRQAVVRRLLAVAAGHRVGGEAG